MNLDSGYFAGVAASGSIDYFALLFCPQAHREEFRILLAFEKLMNELSLNTMDPQIRQAKLGWWANEFSRMSTSEPVHPLANAVSKILARKGLSPAPLLEFFSAVARESGETLPADPDELLDHAERRGALLPLFAQILLSPDPASTASREAFTAVGGARFFTIIFGAQHNQHQRRQQAEERTTADPRSMQANLIEIQLERMSSTLPGIPEAERPRLVPILVFAQLVRNHLMAIQADAQNESASQLRRLAHAWRSARRASRGKLPF